MAQPSLLDRAIAARDSLTALDGPQVSTSTDNSQGQPPQRVYIYGDGPTSPNGGGNPDAVGGGVDVGNSGIGEPPPIPGGNALPEPTPQDNTDSILEQRRQQAMEAMKAQGFDGYTPDLSDAQQWTPEQQNMTAKAVTDIMAGFNISVARTLALPREQVDRAMGMLGLDYMQHGGPQQMTIDAMNRMGIPAYEVENLANKIGQGALPALATWAALQLAAPAMAANQGTSATAYALQHMGEWALKHPVVGLWLGQAAQAGGETALHVVEPTTPIGRTMTELGGNLAGGMLPGAVKGAAKLPFKMVPGSLPVAKKGVELAGKGINAISDALPSALGNAIKKYNPLYQAPISTPHSEGIINPNLNADRLQTFAKDQIFAAQTYQERAIENAINSIPTSGTPQQIQTRTHDLMQNAERISKRIVSSFWDRVPLKTKIPVSDLKNDVVRLRAELTDSDNVRPDTMIEKVMEVVRLRQEPGSGRFIAPKPTIQKLRDLQSQIGTAITEERARDAPREGMVRNMARLSEMIDTHIARELPNNTSIEQARNRSKFHNDLFSRGPINDILNKKRTGDFRVPPAESIDTLMQKTDGLQALKNVQEGLSAKHGVRFVAEATAQERAQLDQMISSAQDSIRTSFREVAEQGPQKVVAFSQKNEDAIRALGRVAGELQFAAQKISAALAEQKTVRASALARFAETSGDKAVSNIFAQRDPADVSRQLIVSFRGDPDALEGLRNEVLNQFVYKYGKTNPILIQRMMEEPRYENMLHAVLSGDQWVRLKRMVDTAVRIGVEDEIGWKSLVRSPIRTAGRLIGAKIGRSVAPGTLQGPSIFSKALGTWAEKSLGGTEPSDLLSQAVLDPHWERVLYSRLPTNTKDMVKAKKNYQRLFSVMNTAQDAAYNRFTRDKADE